MLLLVLLHVEESNSECSISIKKGCVGLALTSLQDKTILIYCMKARIIVSSSAVKQQQQ